MRGGGWEVGGGGWGVGGAKLPVRIHVQHKFHRENGGKECV